MGSDLGRPSTRSVRRLRAGLDWGTRAIEATGRSNKEEEKSGTCV